MNTKYIDLIDQTFHFPQDEFRVENGELFFHDISLMQLIEDYGSPLKFTYLPRISENIKRAQRWFSKSMKRLNYQGKYHYCYCTKSSHFHHVLNEALKNDIHIETSSAFDINIIRKLIADKKIDKSHYIICNGFKRDQYIDNIAGLINEGYTHTIPIIDNYEELDLLSQSIDREYHIGIRIASEEDPKFEFYTSRLGIGYKDIVPYYRSEVKNHPKARLKMLHFFINTGIRDTAYYWNELNKCMRVYVQLKRECSDLNALNIGGGFPIKTSLAFEFDYQYMVDEIINQIKMACEEGGVETPDIFTEFGSYTVGESGGTIYTVLYQKQQNDREKWNMINSSFITTLPDTWAINRRFIMLPINKWENQYERVLLGGLTCDSDDYYNSEQHINAIYLPKFRKDSPLYIGFFNTGAYQDTIGGYGGLQHCLIPQPKYILIDKKKADEVVIELFNEAQQAEDLLSILGY